MLVTDKYTGDIAKELHDLKDQVNHPEYYNQNDIETITVIDNSMDREEFRGYLKGNIIKYVSRHMHKGMPLKDLLKAEWYLAKLIEEVEGKLEDE